MRIGNFPGEMTFKGPFPVCMELPVLVSSSGDTPAEASTRSSAAAADMGALVDRIAEGEVPALTSLYDSESPWVHGLVLRIVRDAHIAEEVTLDVFLQVWRQAKDYRGARGNPRAWLTTIARSRAIDRLRSTRSRREVTIAELPNVASSNPASDDGSDPELSRRAVVALQGLPVSQRVPIELAFFEGLTHREIAARLGRALGTVKTQIRLGLTKLRRSLGFQVPGSADSAGGVGGLERG